MKPKISKESNRMLKCNSSYHTTTGSGKRIVIWLKISEISLLILTKSQRRPLHSKYLIVNSHNNKSRLPFWLCQPLNSITKWQVQRIRDRRITQQLKSFWSPLRLNRLWTLQWTLFLRAVFEAPPEMTPQAPIETESTISLPTLCPPPRRTSGTPAPRARCTSTRGLYLTLNRRPQSKNRTRWCSRSRSRATTWSSSRRRRKSSCTSTSRSSRTPSPARSSSRDSRCTRRWSTSRREAGEAVELRITL